MMLHPAKRYSKLSIVVPIFNEEATIEELVGRIIKIDIGDFFKEIIIVDDCSTDATASIVDRLISKSATHSINKITLPKNLGKSQALKVGLTASTGDIVIVQDGDLEYNPSDYNLLLQPFVEHDADVVYGSRFVGAGAKRILYFWHSVGNRLLTLFSNMCSNLNLTDMETGYKAFRGELIRELAPHIKSARFGFEPEITAYVAQIPEIRIYEVGINYWGRTYKEGKKIGWRDGFLALMQIVYYNLFCNHSQKLP